MHVEAVMGEGEGNLPGAHRLRQHLPRVPLGLVDLVVLQVECIEHVQLCVGISCDDFRLVAAKAPAARVPLGLVELMVLRLRMFLRTSAELPIAR